MKKQHEWIPRYLELVSLRRFQVLDESEGGSTRESGSQFEPTVGRWIADQTELNRALKKRADKAVRWRQKGRRKGFEKKSWDHTLWSA